MSKSSSGDRSAARPPSPMARWLPLLASSIFVVFLAMLIQHPQPQLSPDLPALAGRSVGASSALVAAGSPLDGVRIAITGATSGIGLGLAQYLHGLGATIIAVGRSPSKLRALQTLLDGDDDNMSKRRVETFVADLTDLSSVAKAADEIESRFDSISYLINNAGLHYTNDVILGFWKKHTTPQGFDVAFQTNYLSHFLLTEKLLPLLEKSENNSPRIVQVSSSFHWLSDGSDLAAGPGGGAPRASDGDAKSFFHRERSYANSKLAQIMHGRSLSRKLTQHDSKVRVVSICPGWVATNVTGSSGFNKMLLQAIAYPNDGFGLASTLNAMFLPDAGAANGKTDYFVNSVAFDILGLTIEKMGLEGRRWPAATGFRDALSWAFAVTLLWTQRFASGAQFSTSSPESYQQSIQDELYNWSKSAVSEWL